MALQQKRHRTVTGMPAQRDAADDAVVPMSSPPDRPHLPGKGLSDDSLMGLALLLMMVVLVVFSGVLIWLGTYAW